MDWVVGGMGVAGGACWLTGLVVCVAIQCVSRLGVMCTWAMLSEPSTSLLAKAWPLPQDMERECSAGLQQHVHSIATVRDRGGKTLCQPLSSPEFRTCWAGGQGQPPSRASHVPILLKKERKEKERRA